MPAYSVCHRKDAIKWMSVRLSVCLPYADPKPWSHSRSISKPTCFSLLLPASNS